MKRINTRGINLANKCMIMAAIAYNLKKMMKFKTQKPNVAMVWLIAPSGKTMDFTFLPDN